MGKLKMSYYYSPGEIPPGITLGEYFEETAKRYPDRPALIFREKRYTWKELKHLVDKLTLAFIELGMRRGDMVIILFPNRPEFIITLLAAARLGAVSIPVSERLRRKEIEYILRQTEAQFVVSVSEFWGFSFANLFHELRESITTLRHVILSGAQRYPEEIILEDLLRKDWREKYPENYYAEVY